MKQNLICHGQKCITSEISIIPAVSGNQDADTPVPHVEAIQRASAIFKINIKDLLID